MLGDIDSANVIMLTDQDKTICRVHELGGQ